MGNGHASSALCRPRRFLSLPQLDLSVTVVVGRNRRKKKRNVCRRSQERLSVVLGHNFGCRFGRPVERVSMRVPCPNMGQQSFSQLIQASSVADAQPLALHKAKPLFDLVHPRRQCDLQKPTDKARMSLEPGLHLLAFLHTRVIEDHKDVTNGRWNLPIQLGELSLGRGRRRQRTLPRSHGSDGHGLDDLSAGFGSIGGGPPQWLPRRAAGHSGRGCSGSPRRAGWHPIAVCRTVGRP